MNRSVKKITLSGLFIALGLLLPFITGNIQSLGINFLPMHLPVLIAGFVLGGKYGFIVGFITPLLRSLLFTMPPMYPVAIAMAFELGFYGLITGWLYRSLRRSKLSIIIALIGAMIGGRLVWGIVTYILLSLGGTQFTLGMFYAGVIANSLIGIIIQLILVPIIVIALERAGFLRDER